MDLLLLQSNFINTASSLGRFFLHFVDALQQPQLPPSCTDADDDADTTGDATRRCFVSLRRRLARTVCV